MRLFLFAGSNACLSSSLLLDHAGLDHERVVLKPGLHALQLKLRGFPGTTVPALELDGRKIVGSRRIALAIAELVPEAGLLPQEAAACEAVLEAERVGERLQKAVRRVLYVAAQRDAAPVRQLVDATYAGWPGPARALVTRALVPAASFGHRAKAERIDGYLERVAECLDELDRFVEEGVLGGEVPNVADFQAAPNVTALTELGGGVGEHVRARPIGQAALRLLPEYPVRFGLELPPEWTERLLGRAAG